MASPGAGRVWLITGTSSGFGRRLVSAVLARGDRVIATARTLSDITGTNKFDLDSEDRGPAPVEPQGRGPERHIHCAELDISVGTERVKQLVDAIVRESGWTSVDVLVNNAGVGIPAFVEEGGVEMMRNQYQTNVFGTLDVTMAVLPCMRKQKSGTVVMMGSRSAWRADIKGYGFYSSSKAAIHAIAETMAVELEPFGIRMLVVQPGSFRTEGIYRNDFDASNPIADYDGERERATKTFKAPAGKQPGDPVKAMRALVEVVCGDGRAGGKEWPLYLVLGKDAERDVRKKCARMIDHLEEWKEVIRDVDLDDLD